MEDPEKKGSSSPFEKKGIPFLAIVGVTVCFSTGSIWFS
jgi:hypothetical protein